MVSWDFVPNHMVVENLPPDQPSGFSMNGWYFTAKPTVPWQNKFKVTIHGLQWFLLSDGKYDNTTHGPINARRFEEFVETHGKWRTFDFPHPHFGTLQARFSALPAVPKGDWNSNGVIPAFEVELVHHNPAFKAGQAPTGGVPSNVSVPGIVGNPQETMVLTASTGTWTNNPTSFAYQWRRNGVVIAGATATTYTLVSADVGTTITVTVTATNAQGNGTATSAPTAQIAPSAPVNQTLPVITGSAIQGQTLSCSTGTWTASPTSFAYQWRRNGVAVSGATASTYLLTNTDAGSVMTCTVTATNAGGSASATSNATGTVIPLAPVNTVVPTISGSPSEASTLSVTSNGTWTNNPASYAYQWLRNGVAIAGATASTYLLVTADVGTDVSCRVTATNAGGSTASVSNALGPIQAASPLAAITLAWPVGWTMGTNPPQWKSNFDNWVPYDVSTQTGDEHRMMWRRGGTGAYTTEAWQGLDDELVSGGFTWPLYEAAKPLAGGQIEIKEQRRRMNNGVQTAISAESNILSDNISAPAASWDYTDMGVDAIHWFDAQDAGSFSPATGAIASITNKGTSGQQATQGTTVDRPSRVATSNINSLPAIRSTGSTTHHMDGTLSFGSMTDFSFGGSLTQLSIKINGVDYLSNSFASLATPSVVAVTWTAGSGNAVIKFYQNGIVVSQITTATATNPGAVYFVIRAASAGNIGLGRICATNILFNRTLDLARSLDADFGEFLYYDYVPVNADHQKIEGRMAHKWDNESNLDAGHPYRTNPPTV